MGNARCAAFSSPRTISVGPQYFSHLKPISDPSVHSAHATHRCHCLADEPATWPKRVPQHGLPRTFSSASVLTFGDTSEQYAPHALGVYMLSTQ
jgi:hypothetical protein